MKSKILFGILLMAAALMIGCGEDDGTKADLKWVNDRGGGVGDEVTDIQWMSGASVDQTWDGTVADTGETGYKGIGSLTGEGECLDGGSGGTPSFIRFDVGDPNVGVSVISTDSATINENAAATLYIDNLTTK